MSRRLRVWLMIIVVLLPMAVFVIDDGIGTVAGVGRTDLEIEFVITDAATGFSISDARLEFQSEGDDGFVDKPDQQVNSGKSKLVMPVLLRKS